MKSALFINNCSPESLQLCTDTAATGSERTSFLKINTRQENGTFQLASFSERNWRPPYSCWAQILPATAGLEGRKGPWMQAQPISGEFSEVLSPWTTRIGQLCPHFCRNPLFLCTWTFHSVNDIHQSAFAYLYLCFPHSISLPHHSVVNTKSYKCHLWRASYGSGSMPGI